MVSLPRAKVQILFRELRSHKPHGADRQTNKVFKIKLDFLGSAVFKNMPPTAGDTGLVTDSGKFHLLQGNWTDALEHTLEPVLGNKRSHWLNGHESEQIPRQRGGWRRMEESGVLQSKGSQKVRQDRTKTIALHNLHLLKPLDAEGQLWNYMWIFSWMEPGQTP